MTTFKFDIPDPKAELIRLAEMEQTLVDGAQTKIVRRFHQGKLDGFHMAIQTVDAAERSQAAGEPVEFRGTPEIYAEYEGVTNG
jgi:hypothetical protein